MISIFVTIKLKPGFADRFRKEVLGDAQGSVRDEPGCFRFDVLHNSEDPDTFHLYEVYADETALETHRNMPHYKKWRAAVQDWFDGDVKRVVMKTVFPSEEGWKKQKPHLLDW